MHAKRFLQGLLGNTIHKSRAKALIDTVLASICAKKLSLTALGRNIQAPIQERSGIQKVNRLLGNAALHRERIEISRIVSLRLIDNRERPDILVDWTKYPESKDVVLRASMVSSGRSLTLYQERHPERKLGNNKVEKQFLRQLKDILPCHCRPVIITDAGFHNDWFREIRKYDWDYIGRIRGMKKFRYSEKGKFVECSRLWKKAGKIPKCAGSVILTKKNPFETCLYLVKGKLTGRKARTKSGKFRKDKDSRHYARMHREPWLLASSLKGRGMARRVVKKYGFRMQIEQEFRDMKGNRYGFSLKESKTCIGMRRDILLLIGMMSSLTAWVIGAAAERLGLHRQFQSNSVKSRRVISLVYLGCRVITKKLKIPMDQVWESIHLLREEAGVL